MESFPFRRTECCIQEKFPTQATIERPEGLSFLSFASSDAFYISARSRVAKDGKYSERRFQLLKDIFEGRTSRWCNCHVAL